jgi:hypothetical protein
LGVVAGLLVGTIGALAYSHYLGEGSLLSDLQAQLDAANADLAKVKTDKIQLSKETSGVSDQVDELAASNADLRKQLDQVKSAPPAPPAQVSAATLGGLIMGMMRGGGGPFQAQQRLFVMQSRLKLTAEQSATIKAAMDADAKARRDLMRQRFQNGGKVDPAAAAAANTLDKTLATVLSPDQQTAYQQLQTDEKTARAETSATSQVDGMMPLLQLSDSQKEAAMDALYQVQMGAPDPNSLMADPNPMASISSQAQATEAALTKVLTPEQQALYQRQSQVQADAMAAFRGNRGGGNGGGNGGGAAPNANATGGSAPSTSGTTTAGYGGSPAPSTPSTSTMPTTSPAPTTNADGSAVTPAATTNADGSAIAPAATTNAAPSP